MKKIKIPLSKKIVLIEDLPDFLKAGIQLQIEQQHPELISEISG